MAFSITSNCTGCGACARMCPVSAISGTLKEPHVINRERCVDCGVCGRICAKGAVLDRYGNLAQAVKRSKWPYPHINHSECTACSICVDICGHKALVISDPCYPGDIEVFAVFADRKQCVGCGMCATECPVQAITMEVGA